MAHRTLGLVAAFQKGQCVRRKTESSIGSDCVHDVQFLFLRHTPIGQPHLSQIHWGVLRQTSNVFFCNRLRRNSCGFVIQENRELRESSKAVRGCLYRRRDAVDKTYFARPPSLGWTVWL
jgi:hypothetical protein